MLFVDRNHDASALLVLRFERKYQKACPFNQNPQFTEFKQLSFVISHKTHVHMDLMTPDVEICLIISPVNWK